MTGKCAQARKARPCKDVFDEVAGPEAGSENDR